MKRNIYLSPKTMNIQNKKKEQKSLFQNKKWFTAFEQYYIAKRFQMLYLKGLDLIAKIGKKENKQII